MDRIGRFSSYFAMFSFFAMSTCSEDDDQEVYGDIAAGQGNIDMD